MGDVYLVGHSAGCAVALAAGDVLPPDSLRRIVLLAPSISADYDVRPALRSARDGIDVFFSSRDVFYLGFGAAITGTADRRWSSPAAGRTGSDRRLNAAKTQPFTKSFASTLGSRASNGQGTGAGIMMASSQPICAPTSYLYSNKVHSASFPTGLRKVIPLTALSTPRRYY
jgi:pimeloyl-ACP methyl ester carboxylesterase